MADPSLIRFRAVVEGALAQLEARREEVNDLNVFPVADGDTGDNMALTLRAVLDELDRLSAQGDIDDIGRDEIVDSVARAALLGARGNSGVILSQLIRGAAEELISRPGDLVDPVLIGAAMARAADRAYGSVREPAEGTILTVVREMAHRVAREIAHMENPQLRERVDDETQNAMIAGVLEGALDAGQDSLKRGQDLLAVLRDAGVVDAGGYGLTIIFAGVIAALRGRRAAAAGAPRPGAGHAPAARVLHVPLLHELRRRGRGSRPVGLDPRARGDRRQRARRRRADDAEDPRPHRRPGGRHRRCSGRPARSPTSTSPTCTSRCASATSASRAPCAAAPRSRSSTAAACASSSRGSARSRSTAARR